MVQLIKFGRLPIDAIMKPLKPNPVRDTSKPVKAKKKRVLDNSNLKPFFGKSPESIWDKDIYTGEGNFSF